MWRVKLWFVYLWRIRPRLKLMDKLHRNITFRITEVAYNPDKLKKMIECLSEIPAKTTEHAQ